MGNMAMIRTQHVQKVSTDRGPVDSDLEYGQMDVLSSKGKTALLLFQVFLVFSFLFFTLHVYCGPLLIAL
jgi:hypothetical protein